MLYAQRNDVEKMFEKKVTSTTAQ